MHELTDVKLSYEFVDGAPQLVDSVYVIIFNRIDYAGRKMLFEYHSADGVDCRLYGRKLYENLRTVAAVLDHSPCGLHVADDAGHPVQNGFGVFLRMDVTVVMRMLSVVMDVAVCIFVPVLIYMCVFMDVVM